MFTRPISKLWNRNLNLFLLTFLGSFCILFHLISFSNHALKSLTICSNGKRTENTNINNNTVISNTQIETYNGINEEANSCDENIEDLRNSSDGNEVETLNGEINNDNHLPVMRSSEAEDYSNLDHVIDNSVHFVKAERRLPGCIIIGVRKGGTRALLEFLNLHPLIQRASDEVHFFDDDVRYGYGLDWYRSQMPYSLPGQVTIEKTPAYFITDSVPHRINSMNSSIKLILIVRDPVTRLISDYAQLAENKAKRDRKMASFEKMVLLKSNGAVNIAYKPIRTSLYSVYYARWIHLFPASQFYVVDGDRLVYDPFPEIQKVESFLGLEHKISRDNFTYNVTKGFYCVRINGTFEKCLNQSKGRPHPAVNPKVIRTLRRFYRPYNYQFYKMTGKNFGWPEV